MITILLVLFLSIIIVLGLQKCLKGEAYSDTFMLFPFGIFVWGDSLLISTFWIVVATIYHFTKNFILTGLFFFSFWIIRSLGETIYWLIEQFSDTKRNDPKKFFYHPIFKNDSVYFVNQVFWQLVFVFALVGLILTVIKL